jgi:superfamily II DNA or RNA helicase
MITLRDYQQTLKTDARLVITRARRICVVLPTGGGKSAILSSIAADAGIKNKTVWILAHRRKLIQQLSETVAKWNIEHGIIQSGKPRTDHRVQVGSVDTVVRRLQDYPAPDLIIVDEAHHLTCNNKWGKVVDAFPDAYLIGFTATPERLDGKGLGEGKGGYMQELVLGPDAKWLTDNGFLAQSVVHSWPIKISDGLKVRAGDYAPEVSAAMLDKPAIMGDVIEAYRKHLDGKTAIANCCTVAHAENVAADFNRAGIAAAAITGKTDKALQDKLFADLTSGELKVLCQCELISEGVDVPSVSGGLMLRPTQSTALWLQQCGRVLRPKPDGSKAIILDFVGNAVRLDLPTAPRPWSLDGRVKRAKDAPGLRVCKVCYAANSIGSTVCSECGTEFEIKPVDDIATVAGELAELAPKGMRLGDPVCVAGEEGVFYVAINPLPGGKALLAFSRVYATRLAEGQADLLSPAGSSFTVSLDSITPHSGPVKRASSGAQTLEDLRRVAAIKGYKPSWADHIYRARMAKVRG